MRSYRPLIRLLVTGACCLLLCGNAVGQAAPAGLPQPILRYDSLIHPVVGANGMVVSQRRLASEIGAKILAEGGNAAKQQTAGAGDEKPD